MYGIGKNQLVRNLCKIAAHSCAYSKQPCDCKFMTDGGDVTPMSEAGSGCPELTVAAMIISQLSEAQFAELAEAAGIIINEDSVDVIQTIAKFQEKRFPIKLKGDFLDEIIAESTEKNPEFPKLMKNAQARRVKTTIAKVKKG